jgi:hypothetical protein
MVMFGVPQSCFGAVTGGLEEGCDWALEMGKYIAMQAASAAATRRMGNMLALAPLSSFDTVFMLMGRLEW